MQALIWTINGYINRSVLLQVECIIYSALATHVENFSIVIRSMHADEI